MSFLLLFFFYGTNEGMHYKFTIFLIYKNIYNSVLDTQFRYAQQNYDKTNNQLYRKITILQVSFWFHGSMNVSLVVYRICF